jgi:hypothetical protein
MGLGVCGIVSEECSTIEARKIVGVAYGSLRAHFGDAPPLVWGVVATCLRMGYCSVQCLRAVSVCVH